MGKLADQLAAAQKGGTKGASKPLESKPTAEAPAPAKKKRPNAVTPNKEAICKEIIIGIAAGESLREMCRKQGIAPSNFILWTNEDPVLAEQYTRARDTRADLFFEDIDDIGDKALKAKTAVEVNGLRLKADILKWKLARMAPKKYGDKVQVGGAEDLAPVQVVVKRYSDA